VPNLQGKVVGARRVVTQFSYLVGFVAAGSLVDRLFGPGMQFGGALAGMFTGWLGTGPGAGITLLMVIWGLVGGGACIVAYVSPVVRDVEVTIPDHDSRIAPALGPIHRGFPGGDARVTVRTPKPLRMLEARRAAVDPGFCMVVGHDAAWPRYEVIGRCDS
jgi:hypothetical protein